MRGIGTALAVVFMAGGAWGQVTPATPAAPVAPRAHSTVVRSFTRRGYLGVGVVEVTDARAKALNLKDDSGVEVKRVDENSPAAKAGLRDNDVILEVDGKRVDGVEQFIHTISDANPGTKLVLTVWRNGAKQLLTATIEARPTQMFVYNGPDGMDMPGMPMPPMPPMPDMAELEQQLSGMGGAWSGSSQRVGFEGEMLTPQLAAYFGVKDGVLVRTVAPKTPAEKAGLRAGDVVTKVNGTPVTSPREISSLVHMARSGKVSLTVVRYKREQTLNVAMPEQKGSGGPDRLQL